MNPSPGLNGARITRAVWSLLLWTWATEMAAAAPEALRVGVAVRVGDRTVTLQRLETLPYVENDYSRRFKFDDCGNPKLAELRERYALESVVAPGRDEFEQQVLLMDWVHHRFQKFGRPTTDARGALEILQAIEEGHAFFCAQYAQLLVSASASLGWVDRSLALRRHQGVAKVGGSTEHSVTEIWSNQHGKWVMLDPTSNLYLERDGVPLHAFEIRQEWFYRDGTNLTFVVGKDRKRYRKADLPVQLQYFPGFGDLSIHPDELDKYGFIGYIPNTDLMDSGYDYGNMFITQDRLCEGTKWHVRSVPSDPAVEPYFPIGQSALSLTVRDGQVWVDLRTMTPNFKGFEIQWEDGDWKVSGEAFVWKLRDGSNRLAVRTRNQCGVAGPVARAVVEVKP